MDYKKKYEEALERAKKWYNEEEPDSYTCIVESIFPELQKNEDEESQENKEERIRKALISILKSDFEKDTTIFDISVGEIIAWLEKQGEQKLTDKVEPKFKVGDIIIKSHNSDINKFGQFTITDITGNKYWYNDRIICDINEQNDWELVEQKPTNNVETKFHEGDWLVDNEDCDFFKVSRVRDNTYRIVSQEGEEFDIQKSVVEHDYHKFTINDAKNGDVLVNKPDGIIGIFQSIGHHDDGGSYNDPSYCFLHCRYDDGDFYADFEHGNEMDSDDATPATKEERDTLFVKMKETGYEWNSDTKELIKMSNKTIDYQDSLPKDNWELIHEFAEKFGRMPEDEDELNVLVEYVLKMQKSAEWSDDDERICQCIIKDQEEALDEVRNDKYGHSEIISDLKEMYRERIDWLKNRKNKVLPQPKQKLGEEDSEAIGQAIIALESFNNIDKSDNHFAGYSLSLEDAIKRLKSLKQRLQ